MASEPRQLKWGVEKRLEFIEFRLYWEGAINRSNIMEQFSISLPQASKDLSQYQEIVPGNIEYDKSQKRYFPTQKFKPHFLQPDASRYLSQLRSLAGGLITPDESWTSNRPGFEVLAMPHRQIDSGILKSVLSAIRQGRALEIEYQSMSRPKPAKRWITPHAFAFDGMRWHARAYCHNREQFRDFLLPRMLKTGGTADAGAEPKEDYVWNEFAKITLKPHPDLTEAQSRAVALDFGMKRAQLIVEVRLGLLYYFLRRMSLVLGKDAQNPHEQHVVLADSGQVKQWLDRAQYKTPR